MDNSDQQNPMQQNGMQMNGIPPYPPQNGMPMNGMPPYPPQNGMPMNGMPPYPPQNGMPMNGMPPNNIPPQWAMPPMGMAVPPAPRTSVVRTIVMIVIAFVGYFLTSFLGGTIANLLIESDSTYPYMFVGAVPEFIFFVVMLILMKKKKVLTSKGNGILCGMLAGGLMIYAAVGSLISTMFMTVDENGMSQYTMPTGLKFGSEQVWLILAILLSAGICEELMFRGVILNALRDCFGRDTFKGTVGAIVTSGVLFGCLHFINLLSGMSMQAVLIQVVAVSGMGAFMGAVYCRCGNLKVLILLHFLMDICVLLPESMMNGTDLIEAMDDTMANPAKLMGVVLYGGVTAFLLRKSVRHQLFTYDLSDNRPDATKAVDN